MRTAKKLIYLALTSVFLLALWSCGSNRESDGPTSLGQSAEEIRAAATFVGSTQCLSCHGDKQNWGHTLHKAVLRVPGEFSDPQAKTESFYAGTINKGLDLLTGAAAPNTTVYFYNIGGTWYASQTNDAAQAADLKFSADISGDVSTGFTLTLTNEVDTTDTASYPVILTYGGERNYKQRYIVPVGKSKHLSPIQYNDKGVDPNIATFDTTDTLWVHYHAERWYDAADNELTEPSTTAAFDGNCAGCHFTGYSLQRDAVGHEMADAVDDPNGAIDFDGDGTMDEINIGCEACHQAGSAHASTQNPAFIINPANLSPSRADMVCGQCHIRGNSVDSFAELGGSTAPFPARLDAGGNLQKFIPGDDINAYYVWDSANGTVNTTGFYWGGEPSSGNFVASKKHHQQYIDKLNGVHTPANADAPSCYNCHDSHNNASPGSHQVRTSRTEGGVKIATANDDDTLCLSCHAGFHPFESLTPADIANINVNGDFNNEIAVVKEAVTAHTQHYYDPTTLDSTSGGSSRCSKCHMPKTAKSALAYDIHAHTFDIIEPAASLSTAPAAGVPNACTGCHAAADDTNLNDLQAELLAKFINNTNPYFDQWATSGHADYSGEAFNHWNEDGDISTSCAKCHSKDGFLDFTLDGTVDGAARLGTVVSCGTCHIEGQNPDLFADASTLWDDSITYAALELVTFPSGATQTLGDSSNMCMACHQGRESGLSVATATANTVEQSPVDYTSYDFINRHYFAAAAIMFGGDVTAGFEYADRTYDGTTAWPGAHGTLTTCTGCHMRGSSDHTFAPAIADCAGCHDDITDFDQLNLPGGGDADYDGDTVAESFQSEIDGFAGDGVNKAKGALLTAIQTYATIRLPNPSPIVYMPGSYPYWFKDNGAGGGIAGNGIPDGGEAGYGNRYRDFDIQLLQATYNFHSAQDPCGDIHNYRYVIQTLYDSMDDLDDDLQNDSIIGNRP